MIGSPNTQREIRFDEQRIGDLQNIQNQVIYYWQGTQKLPATLGDIVDPTRGVSLPADPLTGLSYGYNIKSPLEFSLCATFTRTSTDQGGYYAPIKTAPVSPAGAPYLGDSGWSHGVGNMCFDRKIDTAFYKPLK